jgi:protein-tyrosine phosphatase
MSPFVFQTNQRLFRLRSGDGSYRTGRFSRILLGFTFSRSSAYDSPYRTPDMRPIREFLSEWYGESYAELLLKVNPRRILENRPVLYEPSPERRRKRRWFV